MGRKNEKGFTLVELVITVSVLAILIMTVATGSGIRENARVSSAAESIRSIRTAAENYIAAGNMTYSGMTLSGLKTSGFLPTNFNNTTGNPWAGAFTCAPSTNNTQIVITLSSVSQAAATRLSALFANRASSTSYDSGPKVWSGTF